MAETPTPQPATVKPIEPVAAKVTPAPTIPAVKPPSLALQAKPAVAKPNPAKQAQANAAAARKANSKQYSVRGLRGNKGDVLTQLKQQNIPAAELQLVTSKVQAMAANAVHVDLHTFEESDSVVIQAHIRKLF